MPIDDPTPARIAQVVRDERKRQGMDQRTLAMVADVAVRSVSRIETAQATVQLDVLLRVLARAGSAARRRTARPAVSLGVYWDGTLIGRLTRASEYTREYTFAYVDTARAVSLSLPTTQTDFSPSVPWPELARPPADRNSPSGKGFSLRHEPAAGYIRPVRRRRRLEGI